MSTTEIIHPEVMPDAQKEMLAVVRQNALAPNDAQSLQESFAPLYREAGELVAQSRAVVVTDASQTAHIKLSRAFRLELRKIRIGGEALRKTLKEESLRRGKAIDGFNAILLDLVATEETRLEEQEKIVERMEAARKEALKAEREEIMRPLGLNPLMYQLGEMDADTFSQLIEGQKLANAAKEAARNAAEAERIAKIAADEIERKRINEENARLKREADEKEAALRAEREAAEKERKAADAERKRVEFESEKKLQAERQKAEEAAAKERAKVAGEKRIADAAARKERETIEAKAKAEREAAEKKAAEDRAAREKAERELQAQRDAEEKRKREVVAAAKKAAAAPDRTKLVQLASDLRDVGFPACSTREGQTLAARASADLQTLINWIEAEASKL